MDGIGGLVLCMSKGFQWFLWLMYLQLPFFTLKTRSSILIGRIVVGVIIFYFFGVFFVKKLVCLLLRGIIEITLVLFLTNQFYYI